MDTQTEAKHSTNVFDRLYVCPKPGEACDDSFAHLCEINFGMSRQGAERHFDTLANIPEGYRYHGKVTADYVHDDTVIKLTTPAYDIDGKPMQSYVVIARQATK